MLFYALLFWTENASRSGFEKDGEDENGLQLVAFLVTQEALEEFELVEISV